MRVRPAEPSDATAIAAIYAPSVERSHTSFEEVAPDAAEMARRLAGAPPGVPWLVAVDEDDRVLGYAYAGAHRQRAAYRWAVETSVYIDASAHRRGVGRALMLSLLDLLRARGYRQALAGVALPNAASVALHEALGFGFVGVYKRVGFKDGRWIDTGWWQLALDPEADARGEPPVA